MGRTNQHVIVGQQINALLDQQIGVDVNVTRHTQKMQILNWLITDIARRSIHIFSRFLYKLHQYICINYIRILHRDIELYEVVYVRSMQHLCKLSEMLGVEQLRLVILCAHTIKLLHDNL